MIRLNSVIGLFLCGSLSLNAEVSQSTRFQMDNISNVVQERIALFSITRRAHDPFGKPQDLSVTEVVEIDEEEDIIPEPVGPTLADELAKLQSRVTVLGSSFAVGGNYLSAGDTFRIGSKNDPFTVRVIAVERKRIVFQDVKTKEDVVVDLNGVRKELKPGEEIKIENKPLEINLDE